MVEGSITCSTVVCLLSLHGCRRMVDCFNKEYTDYHIMVRHGTLEWAIYKRYSEFCGLQAALVSREGGSTGIIERHLLPQLPPKHIRTSVSGGPRLDLVARRRS